MPHNPRMKTKPWWTAALAAWLAIAAHAGTAPSDSDHQPVARTAGSFFALSVADIEASGAWYREKLGLRVTMHSPRSGPGAVMVLEGGGLIVELVQHDEAMPLSKLTPERSDAFKVHGYFKAGVIVSNFDQMLALLKARAVPIAFGPYAAKDGRRANFIIRDNAGNLIHFFGG
jgi:catechol 2,3-dioxygenase-like lactoylglutathione lyase family enzyme